MKSTKVLPIKIIRMKLTKEGRVNYVLLNEKSTQPNKIYINISFIDQNSLRRKVSTNQANYSFYDYKCQSLQICNYVILSGYY